MHRLGGEVAAEELVGDEGFSGPSSLLYPRHSPSAIVRIDPADIAVPDFQPNQPLTPYHVRTTKLPAADGDLVSGRIPMLGNDDVVMAYASATSPSPL